MSLLEVIEEYLERAGIEKCVADPAYYNFPDGTAGKLFEAIYEVLSEEDGTDYQELSD